MHRSSASPRRLGTGETSLERQYVSQASKEREIRALALTICK